MTPRFDPSELTAILKAYESGNYTSQQLHAVLADIVPSDVLQPMLDAVVHRPWGDMAVAEWVDRLDDAVQQIDPGDTIRYLDPGELDPDMQDHVAVCGTCGLNLNQLNLDGELSWTHAQPWRQYDHEPVVKLLPRDKFTPQICDFCGSRETLHWRYIGKALRTRIDKQINDLGSHWSACEGCGVYINAGDLEGLADRVSRVSRVIAALDPASQIHARREWLNMWSMFFPTVHTTQYLKPPAALNPRLMPKLQAGLAKFWSNEHMFDTLTRNRKTNGQTFSLPGAYCEQDEEFTVRFHPADNEYFNPQWWKNFAHHLVTGIWASGLYWISAKFSQLSVLAGQDFESVQINREDLPSDFGFMVYEEPIGEIERPGGTAAVRAVSWSLVPRGIWINLYIQGEEADPDIDVPTMREKLGWLMCPNTGAGFPFDTDIDLGDSQVPNAALQMVRTILATWFLMRQPGVTGTQAAPVDKKYARAYKRAHGRTIPDVQLVDLRRRPARPGQAIDGVTHQGRKLSVRVYRRGHWKNQPYGPKRGLRRKIYVSGYIAGPDNAPLKAPTPVVKVLK